MVSGCQPFLANAPFSSYVRTSFPSSKLALTQKVHASPVGGAAAAPLHQRVCVGTRCKWPRESQSVASLSMGKLFKSFGSEACGARSDRLLAAGSQFILRFGPPRGA